MAACARADHCSAFTSLAFPCTTHRSRIGNAEEAARTDRRGRASCYHGQLRPLHTTAPLHQLPPKREDDKVHKITFQEWKSKYVDGFDQKHLMSERWWKDLWWDGKQVVSDKAGRPMARVNRVLERLIERKEGFLNAAEAKWDEWREAHRKAREASKYGTPGSHSWNSHQSAKAAEEAFSSADTDGRKASEDEGKGKEKDSSSSPPPPNSSSASDAATGMQRHDRFDWVIPTLLLCGIGISAAGQPVVGLALIGWSIVRRVNNQLQSPDGRERLPSWVKRAAIYWEEEKRGMRRVQDTFRTRSFGPGMQRGRRGMGMGDIGRTALTPISCFNFCLDKMRENPTVQERVGRDLLGKFPPEQCESAVEGGQTVLRMKFLSKGEVDEASVLVMSVGGRVEAIHVCPTKSRHFSMRVWASQYSDILHVEWFNDMQAWSQRQEALRKHWEDSGGSGPSGNGDGGGGEGGRRDT
ncbi:unnamed protein product [Vitrella brassicaformis CCMP3155]|uniref:Uncharacterized protein n=1 Tax=Vitrella brassicaformis (strain CCMP3155) TaxID=1169540 RepID=A0A0G4FYQ8_VITBC|nr:unnamed protein product [Vitrella brassicaformis CCMP3155]|eukprot:CEM20199.1 unnamed protein product [Vitrella brassicaformis CCMP3155]